MTKDKKEKDNNIIWVLVFVLFLSVIEITSRTLLKKARDNDDKLISWRVGLSTAIYIGVIIMLFYAMNYGKFITISALWDAGTIILGTFASYFILKETISVGEGVGLGFIIIGVIIMAYFTK